LIAPAIRKKAKPLIRALWRGAGLHLQKQLRGLPWLVAVYLGTWANIWDATRKTTGHNALDVAVREKEKAPNGPNRIDERMIGELLRYRWFMHVL